MIKMLFQERNLIMWTFKATVNSGGHHDIYVHQIKIPSFAPVTVTARKSNRTASETMVSFWAANQCVKPVCGTIVPLPILSCGHHVQGENQRRAPRDLQFSRCWRLCHLGALTLIEGCSFSSFYCAFPKWCHCYECDEARPSVSVWYMCLTSPP